MPELDEILNADDVIDEFYRASKEFCHYWTRDSRNTHDPIKVEKELGSSRHRLYKAYENLKKLGLA